MIFVPATLDFSQGYFLQVLINCVVSWTVRGGLSLREGLQLVEVVQRTGALRAMDMVEVNPILGTTAEGSHTAHTARLIILGALFGYRGI